MHPGHDYVRDIVSRRTFLVAGGIGLGGLHLPSMVQARSASPNSSRRRVAKSTILIWLSGGASHIDCWDMKPNAPVEYRGEFKPVATSAPGVQLCEHLPLLGKQAHHLAVVRSLGHFGRGTGDHHAGYYYNLTGHEPDQSFRALLNNRKPFPSDWPSIGSVVAYKRPAHPFLPQQITLPQKPGFPEYTRPGQFAARLGLEYDPVYVLGKLEDPLRFASPTLTLEGNINPERLGARRLLLGTLDQPLRAFEQVVPTRSYNRQQEKAFTLLCAAQSKAAFDITREPSRVRERYGETLSGMSMLMARRLVEAEVPFISVFWQEDPRLDKLCKSGGAWDTHGSNFHCLRNELLPHFDRCFSALLEDLHDRGLLETTLVMVNSEMGRNPKVGDPRSGGVKGAGRDHWTNCMSVLFAGGGIRGGQCYGTSDKIAAYPAERPVAPEDIARTVYFAMGIENLEATDREGKPFHLLAEGSPIRSLF